MRQVASFLLCGVAMIASAAEVWRWKDANGVVHYSDNPAPGAERIVVNSPRPSGDGEQTAVPAPESSYVSPPEPAPAAFVYRRCAVASPTNDQTFFGVQAIDVSLLVEPGLQDGHRIQVFVNGAAHRDWPAGATAYTFPEVFRGSHTLSVRIVDEGGRTVCTAPPITFHLRQPSVLSPAR